MAADTARYSFPYQEDTDAPDGPALGQDLAEAVEAALGTVEDDLEAADQAIITARDAAWTAYTPTLTAGGGSPTIGSGGVLHGRYKQIGKTVHVEVYALLGTSPSFGTGGIALSLPVTSVNQTNAGWTGTAYLRDASATSSGHLAGFATLAPNASVVSLFAATAASQQVTATTPFTWVATDFLRFSITYEGA